MDFRHTRFLIGQAKSLGAKMVSLFGFGEPLLDQNLEYGISLAHDLKMKTFITSNGALLNSNRSHSLLDAGLSKIRFSVHGIEKDTYEDVHRGLSFMQVVRNIDEFCSLRGGNHKSCAVEISVIPMHNEKVNNIFDFWRNHDIDHLEIWRPHNWSYGKSFRGTAGPKKMTCGRPFNGPVQINADGKMMVCCFDYDARLIVGDTFEDYIEDILKGDDFERIRMQHRCGNHFNSPCSECDQRNIEFSSPLLYSSKDPDREIGKTSSLKFKLEA